MSRPLDPDDEGPAKNVNLRIPQRYYDLLEEEVQRLQQENPDLPASRSLVIRNLIRRALVEHEEPLVTTRGECVACGQLPPTRRSLRGRLQCAERARARDPNGKRGITRQEIEAQLGVTKLGLANTVTGKGATTTTGRRVANLLTKKGY